MYCLLSQDNACGQYRRNIMNHIWTKNYWLCSWLIYRFSLNTHFKKAKYLIESPYDTGVFKLCRLSSLQWRHNGGDSVSNHQPHDCLLNGLFRCRSKKTPKLRVAGLCAGNSPGTGEFSAQMASNAENVSIWWCHHGISKGKQNKKVSVWWGLLKEISK